MDDGRWTMKNKYEILNYKYETKNQKTIPPLRLKGSNLNYESCNLAIHESEIKHLDMLSLFPFES